MNFKLMHTVKDSIDEEKQEAINALKDFDSRFMELEANDTVSEPEVMMFIAELFIFMDNARSIGLSVDDIRNNLSETFRLHSKSTFVTAIQDSRDRPGNWKLIDMIVNYVEKSVPGTIGHVIGQMALASKAADQHRQKLRKQTEFVRKICKKFSHPVIVSMACGACHDLAEARNSLIASKSKVFLVDHDQSALDQASLKLDGVDFVCIKKDALRFKQIIKRIFEEHGPVHAVIFGGYLDYVKEDTIKRFILFNEKDDHPGLSQYLEAGGRIMLTNISDVNPQQLWMEVFGYWFLFGRSRETMLELLKFPLGFSGLAIEPVPNGLTWLGYLTK